MRAPILLVALLATTTAHANNNELSLGSFGRSLRSSSANALSPDELFGGTLGIGRQLHLGLHDDVEVWATGGFQWGGNTGTLFQTMQTELDTLGFSLGGRARYRLFRWLAVGARLDVGTQRTALTIRSMGKTLTDAAWGGTSTAAAHVDLALLVTRPFSLGLRFEYGYVTATAPSLSPREDNDASKITIDEMQASIGHLDLAGRFFSASLMAQF